MARPERNSVDYFPFFCEEGNKMFVLEATYGNDGFATFVKLLRELAKTDYHYLNLSKQSTLMYLSAKCKVSKEVLEAIINDLVDLGKFDHDLWTSNRIIWCQDFIDSIQDAYLKRNNKCLNYDGLLTLLDGLGVRKLSKCNRTDTGNAQIKENKIKEEESKEEGIFELVVWPTFQDFWEKYDKKVGRPNAEKLYKNISQGAREKIMEHLDSYVFIEKQFRKDPERYLKTEAWNNEVVLKQQPVNNGKSITAQGTLDRHNSYRQQS